MNFYAISMILMALIACAMSFSSNDDDEVVERAAREKRFTCDLFSWGGKVGHTACAAKCLAMGKVGGTCKKGMCRCRKEKIHVG